MLTSPLVARLMVPKGGFEPPRGLPTTPSRWRVYQFHHFGRIFNPSHPPFSKGGQRGITSSVQGLAPEVGPASPKVMQETSELASPS